MCVDSQTINQELNSDDRDNRQNDNHNDDFNQSETLSPNPTLLPGRGRRHWISRFVIPGLTRNPVFFWIPAGVYPVLRYGAGMTDRDAINDAVYRIHNPQFLPFL